MVNIKPKDGTCKSDSYKAAKSRIESYVKVGIVGNSLYLFCGLLGRIVSMYISQQSTDVQKRAAYHHPPP